MARTLLTPVTVKGPYPGTVAANDLDIPFASSDTANGNYFVASGRDLLLWRNADAGVVTITIGSAADPYGRTGDIATFSVGIGELGGFWFGKLDGWVQSNGQIYINTSDDDLTLVVIRVPA